MMKVKILKDVNGNVFSPKVSAESVYRKGAASTVEDSLNNLQGDVSTIHDILGGGSGGDISIATVQEIRALFQA